METIQKHTGPWGRQKKLKEVLCPGTEFHSSPFTVSVFDMGITTII